MGGHLQISPCLHPDVKGVTKECVLLLQLLRSTPRSTSVHSKKRSISTCVKIRDRKVFIYILCVGAFWLSLEISSLPSIPFLLSCLPCSPLLPPAFPSPLPAPDEFLLLPGIRAGRLFCGWRDCPWQLHKSQGGATWVPSRPLTHCRGATTYLLGT